MDQDFNLWQKLFQSKPVMRATGGLRYLLGNEQEKNQLSDLWGEDVDNSLPAIMGLTKPFRMGSNILGQYYGSALTGQDMTNQDNQGKFLQWLSSALTPEEQTQIEEKPYLNALKSSAGMASTLMPFAKAGVVGNVGSKMANPTLSKFTNLLSRGGLEGGVGGFGYSREGKELQDTLLGMVLGAGGEVLGGLISDPTFRRGMGQEIMKGGVTPEGRYTAFAKLGDDIADDADNVIDLTKDRLYLEAKKYDTPEEFIKRQPVVYHGSTSKIKSFNNKQGTFFTDDFMNAEGYASGENVYEGVLDLKNPLVIDAKGRLYNDLKTKLGKTTEEVVSNVDSEKYDGVIFKNIKDSWIDDVDTQEPGTIYYSFKPRDSFLNESQLKDLWEQAHTQYVGGKLPKNKDRYIKMLTGEEGDENQLHNLDYKGLKKEPGRISKTHEEDLREEMRKTAERWGLYR